MEIITMESTAYKELIEKIEQISVYVRKNEQQKEDNKVDVWLNSKEVASLLGISLRSLQRLRESGQIGYAIFLGNCRYHFSEVERLVGNSIFNFNAQTLEEFKRNYLLRTGGKKL